ncbi:MAG TPA: hypothetical protein VIO38_15345 [Rariglobus sp.]
MFSSNEGNEGNVGNRRGSGGSGAFAVLPDRVDLPWVNFQDVASRRAEPPIKDHRTWSADWYAWLVLSEFAQAVKLPLTKPIGSPAGTIWLDEPVRTGESGELDDLLRLAESDRADALGEIVAQHDGFLDYFLALLSITHESHPHTVRLLHVGVLVGAYVSLHFKGLAGHQRLRPCQRAPALMPPVPMPAHPSYPSGHATQAHLMSKCVGAALSASAPDLAASLTRLAERIARNREIAGLHFRTDAEAGRSLAEQAYQQLNALAATTRFKTTLAEAVKEWS